MQIKKVIQRLKQGFSDSDTWELDRTIIRFTLPRLKRFRELANGYPDGMTMEEFLEDIDKIIFWMEDYLLEDENYAKWLEVHNIPEYKSEIIKIGKDISKYKIDEDSFKIYNEACKKITDKWDEGKQLFFKHFNNLWW